MKLLPQSKDPGIESMYSTTSKPLDCPESRDKVHSQATSLALPLSGLTAISKDSSVCILTFPALVMVPVDEP
jgi:hypothetical protein